MKKVFFGYLKENMARIIMYAGFIGIFWIVFYLYNIRTDAVEYAFLLSFVWLLGCGAFGFIRYKRRHEELLDIERRASAELYGLPETVSAIEKDYQRILEKVYHDKMELESAGREFRREIANYYSMWVHQIKTPIAAMKVLLQAHGQTEEEKELLLVREIRPELFKIERYVEMVLTYLRTADMNSDLVFEYCALDDIIRQAVKKYSQMFILQKIKLNYEPTGKMALTDEKWLTFVVEQLLSNALKYTRTGSISIYMEGDCLVIEDTGIGIWAEDLPRIFEKGFTGYNGRENKKSTGIGLYLCKTITDKLRHGLRLESEVGKGTKAYIGLGREEDGGFLTNL